MEAQKTLNSQRELEKEEQSQGYHVPSFQTILQSYTNQNNLLLAQKQTYRSMEQNKEPRSAPTLIWVIDL